MWDSKLRRYKEKRNLISLTFSVIIFELCLLIKVVYGFDLDLKLSLNQPCIPATHSILVLIDVYTYYLCFTNPKMFANIQ